MKVCQSLSSHQISKLALNPMMAKMMMAAKTEVAQLVKATMRASLQRKVLKREVELEPLKMDKIDNIFLSSQFIV